MRPWSLALAYARCLQVLALARSVPGLWLMLPGGRPGARSSLVYARCAPGVPLARSVPGRGLMLPGCALASVRLVVC